MANGNGKNGHGADASPALSPRLAALAAVLTDSGRMLLLPHDYPDPDAFASAAAMHLLLKEKFGVPSRIVFTGMVNRAENREMLKHCRYGFSFATRLQLGRKRPAALVLDGVPWSGRVTVPPGARVVGVIGVVGLCPEHAVRHQVAHARLKACVQALVKVSQGFGGGAL